MSPVLEVETGVVGGYALVVSCCESAAQGGIRTLVVAELWGRVRRKSMVMTKAEAIKALRKVSMVVGGEDSSAVSQME